MMKKYTAQKIGVGEDTPLGKVISECREDEGPFRPKTTAISWQVIEERESEFEILIFD